MTDHVFVGNPPDPTPVGYVWWKDEGARAACICGWSDTRNSHNRALAEHRWLTEHLHPGEDAA